MTDENPRTYWVAASNEAGQTLTVNLGATKTLRAIQNLDVRALNAGVGYHVAVEAFDENGVSALSRIVAVP